MIETRDRIVLAAESRGLAADHPVIVALNNVDTGYKDVRFVVSHTEPVGITSPLNVMWIVSDPVNADFNKVLRRSSRSNSGTYEHAWSEVLQEPDLYVSQVWDLPEPEHQVLYDHIALIGNPHRTRPVDMGALPTSGGKLTGQLETRTLEAGEQYAQTEVFPRSFLESSLGPLRSITNSLMMYFGNLNNQVGSIRNRTTTVEGRMTTVEESMAALETSAGDSAAKGYAHTQETAAQEWAITHNLGTMDVLVQVYENGEVVWPSSTSSTDENTVSVKFAIPITGSARIIPIA